MELHLDIRFTLLLLTYVLTQAIRFVSKQLALCLFRNEDPQRNRVPFVRTDDEDVGLAFGLRLVGRVQHSQRRQQQGG
jgi:hypothetical protein